MPTVTDFHILYTTAHPLGWAFFLIIIKCLWGVHSFGTPCVVYLHRKLDCKVIFNV